MKNILILLLVFLCCSGCSSINLFASPDVELPSEVIEAVADARHFIGADQDELLQEYGNPDQIYHDRIVNHVRYDECWTYQYSSGMQIVSPLNYSINFYISNGVVQAVYL